MSDFFADFGDNMLKLFTSIGFGDIVDIIVIAVVVFYLMRLFKNTRTSHLIRGLILLLFIYAVVNVLNMPTSGFIFGKLFSNIVVVLVLIFQPEIRRAVESFGRGRFHLSGLFSKNSTLEKKKINEDISAIVNACINMSEEKVGMLIVVEGKSPLTEIMASGSVVDAAITTPVIENIFFPKAPLHDGAMIIKDGRIASAGCILPLTEAEVSRHLGTRHRAAIGLSEQVDAFVIVVSEETGAISYAMNGRLNADITSAELVEELTAYLMPPERKSAKEDK